MNRGTMGEMKPGGHLRSPNCLFWRHGSHGNHQRRGKGARGHTGSVSDVHGNVFTLLQIPHRDPRSQQTVLERETAAQEKTHHLLMK